MNPLLASARMGGVDPLECAVLSFEQEWRRHGDVRLEQYWPEQCRAQGIDPGDSVAILAELIKADLRLRFDNGQSPTVASYLEQFPKLCETDSRVLSLIYEEFCLREENGEAPDVESFCGRYPRWRDSLIAQLQYHRLFSQAAGGQPPKPRFPEVGESFEEFQLVSLLGRGGMSRVFLARDLSLGGKQVVLKVSVDRGDEPKLHGPLDHPHIVPANSVAFQPERQLRALSMPYRPGLALDVVIARLNAGTRPRKAIELWRVLVDGSAKSLISCADPEKEALLATEVRRSGPRGDGWERFPVRGTYAQGVAWLVMTLARALDYSHRMGTIHRDVKPGNVLLTLKFGPQLFDFNLAESPYSADQAQEAIHGGTLPYMAPEQIEAFLNPDLWGKAGAQADIYSLGLVLRELLTGQMPELPNEKLAPARAMRHLLDRRAFLDTDVRRVDPRIPHGLQAIVAKSLALSPQDRYPDAESFALDLDRFLKHQPLLQADNRSRTERLTNWVNRNRWSIFGLPSCVLGLALLAHRPIADRLKPPVESLAAFQAAVGFVDQEDPGNATSALESLGRYYSEDPLVRSYLAFALDLRRNTTQANAQLARALSTSHGIRKLLDWGADHPKIAVYLEHLAEAAIKDGDNKLVADVLDEHDEEIFVDSMRQYYELAKQALDIVDKLGRTSLKTQALIAKVEEFDGNYRGAFDRLTRSLDAARFESGPLDDPDDSNSTEDLLASHILRCRVAVRWAAPSRKERPFSEPEALLEFLKKVEKEDLKFSENFLKTRDRRFLRSGVKEYEVLQSKLRLMLARGEIEIALGNFQSGGAHLKIAEKTISDLCEAAERCRFPVPKLPKTRQRLRDALSRVPTGDPSARVGADPGADRAKRDSKS